MIRSPFFDDLKLGDRFKTPGVTLTDEAIIDFSLKYDPQYFHMDREAATKSIFGGLVASGWQILALAFRLVFDSGLLVNNLGGNAADEVRWVKTVKAMDTITVVAEVVELKALASRPDRGMVKLKYIVTNQADEIVTTLIVTHFMKRKGEQQA